MRSSSRTHAPAPARGALSTHVGRARQTTKQINMGNNTITYKQTKQTHGACAVRLGVALGVRAAFSSRLLSAHLLSAHVRYNNKDC